MVRGAKAIIIGVYPSAWHVTWQAPKLLAGPDRSGSIAALAVDVEPTVFWDGNDADFGERVTRWKEAVGFVDDKHGSIEARSPNANGSSGKKVIQQYLMPLDIEPDRAAFTDIYPVFLVKTKKPNAAKREQGDAIREEYDSIAKPMGWHPCTLPPRIPTDRLPRIAAATFGDRLVADLTEAAAPLIVTLGEEVWSTVLAIPSLCARAPRRTFSDLYGDAYGQKGRITVGGREVEWLPLVHPGLLRGEMDPTETVSLERRTTRGWGVFHARWVLRMREQHGASHV